MSFNNRRRVLSRYDLLGEGSAAVVSISPLIKFFFLQYLLGMLQYAPSHKVKKLSFIL